MANKNFKVRTGIEAPLIAADDGTTAITLSGANASFAGTITSSVNTGSSFFKKVNTGANVAAGTALAMDNLNVRLQTTTGNNMQVQASAVSGSFSAYTTIVNNVAGVAMSGETNSSGITFTAGTWSSIGSNEDLAAGGDMIIVHVHDNTNLRIYRVTTMRGAGTSPNAGHISIERLA